MKRRIARFITLCIALTMILAPSVSRAYAGPAAGDTYVLEYEKSDETKVVLNPNKAATKPTLSLSQLQVPVNQIDKVQEIVLTVSGANEKYAPTGLHIRFDDRLEMQTYDDEYAELMNGKTDGAKRLSGDSWADFVDTDGVPHGVFTSTKAAGDVGRDGPIWKFRVKIPADAKVGDKYPIEIVYKVNAKNPLLHDIFTNFANDTDGQNMEAWVFTKGIEQGYIEIIGKKAISGDLNGDGIIDACDASVLLAHYAQYSIGAAEPTEDDIAVSDVNKDGLIDAIDASWLLAYYAAVSSGNDISFDEFYVKMKAS